jgi:hypothetical protein
MIALGWATLYFTIIENQSKKNEEKYYQYNEVKQSSIK